MHVWFTSDLHLGHRRIIEFSERPFKTIEEHDEALIRDWQVKVKPGDLVYCLGDFSFHSEEKSIAIAKRLPGNKYLIFGNHDKRLRKNKEFCSEWIWCKDLDGIEVESQKIVLCHYAMVTWSQSHRGAWQLHGHSHGSLKDDSHALRLDVGVDCWDMGLVSFEQIKKQMTFKTFVPVDHHGKND